jgi:hypothetical protein
MYVTGSYFIFLKLRRGNVDRLFIPLLKSQIAAARVIDWSVSSRRSEIEFLSFEVLLG